MLSFSENEQAFKDFITQHQQRVYNTALNLLQNAEDAEEMLKPGTKLIHLRARRR
jgi:DNA-directed RNA polymerase specialized sigma24 family protein